MSKNFLLSKVSVLILAAVVLHSLVVPAWSMEEEDKNDQNSNSAITIKNSNKADENENNSIKYTTKKFRLRELYNITDPQEEVIFEQFYKGALIYRPIEGSDEGMIRLPISDLSNPLEGTFDLSQCGEAGQYLRIATGYRKEKESSKDDKLEIWVAPRFLIERELDTMAKHFKPIMDDWKQEQAPIGIF